MRQLSSYKITVKQYFKKSLIFSFLLLSITSSAVENIDKVYFYKVQAQDNISIILFKLGFKPIYGENGYLKQTLDLNQKSDKTADIVFPGEILKLRLADNYVGNACHRVTPEKEILSTYNSGCYSLMATNANRSVSYIQRRYASTETSSSDVLPPASSEVQQPALEKAVEEKIPEEKVSKEKLPVVYSEFIIGVDTSYSGLFGYDNSDGTSGELLSKLGAGYNFQWKQFWNDNFSTRLGTQGQTFNLEAMADDKVIRNKDNFLFQLDLGASYRIHPKIKITFEAYTGDVPLYRGIATNTYEINLINRTGLGVGLDFNLLKKGPLSLSAQGRYGVLKYTKDSFYNAQDGRYYGYGVTVYHRRENYGLMGSLNFQSEETSVREVDFKYEYLNFILGVVWSWSE